MGTASAPLMPSPRPTPLSSTAASTTPPPTVMMGTTTATAVFTTTASTAESTPTASARPRLSPGGPTMVATPATGPTPATAMAATGPATATGDGIERRTDAWTTDFDNDIKTKNYHHEEPLSEETCITKLTNVGQKRKTYKVQTAMLIVSPSSNICNIHSHILGVEINNR